MGSPPQRAEFRGGPYTTSAHQAKDVFGRVSASPDQFQLLRFSS